MIQIYATFERELMRNELSGYTVFTVSLADVISAKQNDARITKKMVCSGYISTFLRGTPLLLSGEIQVNKYGVELAVTAVQTKSWDQASLVSYLTNLGINYQEAVDIGKKFPDLLNMATKPNLPILLTKEIESLSLERAIILGQKIAQSEVLREVYYFIAPAGGNWQTCKKLFSMYGLTTKAMLMENPYAGMKAGMSFLSCDKLLAPETYSALSENRIEAAVIAAIQKSQNMGNTCIAENELCRMTQTLLHQGRKDQKVPASLILQTVRSSKYVTIEQQPDENWVYSTKTWNAECNVARHLIRLLNTAESLNYDPHIVDEAEKECGMKYSPQQRLCFSLIQKSGVAIVTGGPGTGKTTTVKGIISAYEKLNPDKKIKLCAPTGRASQRMAESTGREATTIHRLLDFRPFGNDETYKDASNPIDADLIVVDESSMLDIAIAAIFLDAVKSGTLVIFIGDINQLPAVGAGNVLHDMIEAKIPTVNLMTVYRQGSESPIIANAAYINSGMQWAVLTDDYSIEKCADASLVALRCKELGCRKFNPEKPFDFQILTPTHKGLAGVSALNAAIQETVNPHKKGKPEIKYGSHIFRQGDKVIMLQNNYDKGYYNGDLGIVDSITDKMLKIYLVDQKRCIDLTASNLQDVSLAYAMTVHKTQGSGATRS